MTRMLFVGFFSKDIERLCRFYADLFGFPEIADGRNEIFRSLDCGSIRLCFHGNAAYDLLGLGDHAKHTGVQQAITFDAASTRDLDEKMARAQSLGATLVKGPFITYYKHYQVVFFDPDGNVFRITVPTTDPNPS